MSVPAHTTAPGERYLTEYDTWEESGHDAGGNPLSRVEVRSYPGGYSLKDLPNKANRFGDGYIIPKDYRRLVHRVMKERPWQYEVIGDDGYHAKYRVPLIGNLYPERPANYDSWGQDIDAAARTKALNKLRSGSMQLGADLGEARKTLNMIATPTIQVLKALRAARSGRWGEIPRHLGMNKSDVLTGRYAANKWLEYQYGWKPLMGTIYDGTQRLKDGFGIDSTSRVAKVTASEYRSYDNEITYLGDKIKYGGYMRVTYGLYYRVSNATIATIDSAGLLNPLSIAWELVPFSFVVDWFVPVGNVLSALTATAGLEFVDGYRSETRGLHENREILPFHYRSGSALVQSFDVGEYRSAAHIFYRSRLGAFPHPGIYTNPKPFSTARVTNALALLRQLF